MEISELKAGLKNNNLKGCYILSGEEDYLKKYYRDEIKRTLIKDKAFEPFNYSLFDGPEVDFAAITDAVKAPPMFSEYKLIEWRYPSFCKMGERDFSAFENLLSLLNQHSYAVVVFTVSFEDIDIGFPKRPSKFMRRFGNKINLLNFMTSSDAQLLSWLKKHFDSEKIQVTGNSLHALIMRVGHSMTELNSEVQKLSYYMKANEKKTLTEEDVEFVASGTPECDTFALSNAVLQRNKKAVFDALFEMKFRRLEPVIIMSMLSNTFSDLLKISLLSDEGMDLSAIASKTKINPYKLKIYMVGAKKYGTEKLAEIMKELTRVDASSKFGGVNGYVAVELFLSRVL